MKKYILMACALLSSQLSVEATEQFVKFSSPAQNALQLTERKGFLRLGGYVDVDNFEYRKKIKFFH